MESATGQRSEPVMWLEEVSYCYGSSDWYLGPLTLSIGAGRLTGLIGPNGSGKSTLLKICARCLSARGKVHVSGRPISTYSHREWAQLIGYLPQQIHTQYDFTVEETVAFGRYPHNVMMGFLGAHDRMVIQRCMEQTELLALRARRLSELSGGERQRVHLATVLAQEPRILLLDEPASALDIHHQIALFQILRECTRSGMTIVMATHDLTLAAHFCDELILLSRGQVVAQGTPTAVITEPLIQQVYSAHVRVARIPGAASPVVVPA